MKRLKKRAVSCMMLLTGKEITMQDLFTATVNKDQVWEMSHFHFHDPYELLFITGGSCSFLVEAELLHGTRGTVLMMKSGLLHMSTSLPDSEYTRYVINFNPADLRAFLSEQTDLLAAFSAERPFLQLSEEEIARVEPLFRSCSYHGNDYGSDLRRNLSFLELLITLGELTKEDREEKPAEAGNSRNYNRVKPVISYILEHPTENMSLDSVAARFNYNKHYLCRVFKTATGISVGKYIMSVRIQYAAEQLRRGGSVQNSGLSAGYRNNSNFISTFKKVMGISPGQYRRQYRQHFGGEW